MIVSATAIQVELQTRQARQNTYFKQRIQDLRDNLQNSKSVEAFDSAALLMTVGTDFADM